MLNRGTRQRSKVPGEEEADVVFTCVVSSYQNLMLVLSMVDSVVSPCDQLYLRGCELNEEQKVHVGRSLGTNTLLNILCLEDLQIGDSGAKALAKGLQKNYTLLVLRLSGNEITDAGATSLAHSLVFNLRLKVLCLKKNLIHDGGAIALARALRYNSSLFTLTLSGNSVSTESVKAFSKSLEKNSVLKMLRLDITDFGFRKINQVLSSRQQYHIELQRLMTPDLLEFLRQNEYLDLAKSLYDYDLKSLESIKISSKEELNLIFASSKIGSYRKVNGSLLPVDHFVLMLRSF